MVGAMEKGPEAAEEGVTVWPRASLSLLVLLLPLALSSLRWANSALARGPTPRELRALSPIKAPIK